MFSGGVTAEESKKLPQYVPDQFRYVCSLRNCKQITCDDSMLRSHMRALHSEIDLYACPHCQENEYSSKLILFSFSYFKSIEKATFI